MRKLFVGKLMTAGKWIFPLILLLVAIVELNKFMKDLDYRLLQTELNQLYLGTVIFIFLVMFLAVLPMVLYDVMLIKILGLKIGARELFEQSLIANSFSNLFGLGGLVGGMIRTYFFHKLESDRIRLLSGIASVSFFYLTGISFLAFFMVAAHRQNPIFLQSKWLYFTVMAIAIYLPVIFTAHLLKHKKVKRTILTAENGMKLFFISILEWTSVFLAIWIVGRILNIPFTIQELFPIYVAAICAGIISMIPGGLGSFDIVFIWGMQYLQIAEEKVLVLLIFYRIGYYLLPFLIGAILFIKNWENPIKFYYYK